MTNGETPAPGGPEAEGRRLHPPVHAGPGSDQPREPAAPVRARRCGPATRIPRRRSHRRRPRPLGSGTVARPGFEQLVAWLCAGEVGAVLCFDASRLASNGRDWHHLLELCGLVEARVIDLDGVYNPCRPNDRLAARHEGQHQRVRARRPARPHARRRPFEGAARRTAHFACRSATCGIARSAWASIRTAGAGSDRLIFSRFRELGSARQVHLSLQAEGVHFPRPSDGKKMISLRVDADPLPQRHRRAQEPILRGRLRLR